MGGGVGKSVLDLGDLPSDFASLEGFLATPTRRKAEDFPGGVFGVLACHQLQVGGRR